MSRKRTLLLVDDDSDLASTLAEQLELTGEFTAIMAPTAASGVAQVKAASPDLILLDVDLPDLDGREACKAVRANGFAGPIIMLTGHGSEQCASRRRVHSPLGMHHLSWLHHVTHFAHKSLNAASLQYV